MTKEANNAHSKEQLAIRKTCAQEDYELLDSGEGEKLERYGKFVLRRPDPQALWKKNLPQEKWRDAHGTFVREGKNARWSLRKDVPESWQARIGGILFEVSPKSFKHTGIFPEQLSNWTWLEDNLTKKGDKPLSVLNLFGYTGGATIACAKTGAKVVHVDASKPSIAWAMGNAKINDIPSDRIRWILDDAAAFVRREQKRGNRYDGIIMDPPSFGRGAKGEVWKLEEGLLPLIDSCIKILADKPLFFLLNGYASGYSATAYKNILGELRKKFGGSLECGELAIEESGSDRLLPAGIFARWNSQH